MMSNTQNKTFDLMIKQLKYEDIGCDYTCTCGFSQYTQKLQLQYLNVTYPPNMNTNTSSHLKGGVFTLNFSIEMVYPVPTCSFIFSSKEGIQTDQIKNLKTKLLPDGMLYKVFIELSIDIHQYNCLENINLTCKVWTRTYDLQSWKIGSCPGENIKNTYMLQIIIYITTAVIIIVVALSILIICHRKKKMRFQNDLLYPMTHSAYRGEQETFLTTTKTQSTSHVTC